MIQQIILSLLVAIRVVESTDGLDVKANGNDYQITKVFVDDVNRIYGTRYVWPRDVKDRETAENMILMYLTYYGMLYKKEFGRVPSKAVISRIYHSGYKGMKRGEGHDYARKIDKALKNNKRKGKCK